VKTCNKQFGITQKKIESYYFTPFNFY